MKVGIFCLVRGKKSIFGYSGLIRRNWSLRRNLRLEPNQEVSFIVFHEGNVSKSQRTLIRFVSGIPLAFVDIGEIFGPFQNQSISKEPHAAGYSLMCRFMYLQVWEYLRNFEIVARVDDDCRIVSLPMRLEGHSVFQGGVLLDDSHGPTNESLPSVLGPDRVKYWHNQIVNTCVYVTRVSFWTETMVQRYLQK